MLIDAANREFEVVVTHSLDRLSRNLMVTLNAFHTFSSNGVTYVSATQEIDYSHPGREVVHDHGGGLRPIFFG